MQVLDGMFGSRDCQMGLHGPDPPKDCEKPPRPEYICPHCREPLYLAGKDLGHELLGYIKVRDLTVAVWWCDDKEQPFSEDEAATMAQVEIEDHPGEYREVG